MANMVSIALLSLIARFWPLIVSYQALPLADVSSQRGVRSFRSISYYFYNSDRLRQLWKNVLIEQTIKMIYGTKKNRPPQTMVYRDYTVVLLMKQFMCQYLIGTYFNGKSESSLYFYIPK